MSWCSNLLLISLPPPTFQNVKPILSLQTLRKQAGAASGRWLYSDSWLKTRHISKYLTCTHWFPNCSSSLPDIDSRPVPKWTVEVVYCTAETKDWNSQTRTFLKFPEKNSLHTLYSLSCSCTNRKLLSEALWERGREAGSAVTVTLDYKSTAITV